MAFEFGFRPCKIEDLKGQPKVQKMLRIYIKAAQIKNESFPHTIITGQSGCGNCRDERCDSRIRSIYDCDKG